MRQENTRLREALCSVLRYHGLISAAVQRVLGGEDIERDSVAATTATAMQQGDKEQESNKQKDQVEEETNTEQVHDNTTRLVSASATEMVDVPASSAVAKSRSPRQRRQSTQATMSSSSPKRVNKESWRKYLMLLSPISERDREKVVVRKPETMSQQEQSESSRTRRSKVQKSYRLPSLKQKLRKGDPFTYT